MADALARLKVLIDSSTPIVVIETVEEVRAVRMVRVASSALNLATFEWSIASGLARCGGEGVDATLEVGRFPGIHGEAATGHDVTDVNAKAIYNSREPAQMLSNLESNETLWASQNIRSYRFTSALLMPPSSFGFIITVSNGAFQNAVDDRTNQPVEASAVQSDKTIETVFQTISRQIENNELEAVTFDSRGVPTSTKSKPSSCPIGAQDCGGGGPVIENFTVLP